MKQSAEFGNALSANTALANLLQCKAEGNEMAKLKKMGFDISPFGKSRFTMLQAEDIVSGIKGLTHTAMDIYSPQDMFLRSEVSTEESLKINGIPLTQVGSDGKYHEKLTTSMVGLYQITGSKLEWAQNLNSLLVKEVAEIRPIPYDLLKNMFYNNREWVNDDRLLVGKAISITEESQCTPRDYFLLISADKGLARSIADSTNQQVMSINPSDLIAANPYIRPDLFERELTARKIIEMTSFRGTERLKKLPLYVLYDTGSERAKGSHLEREIFGSTDVYYRKSMYSTHSKTGHRVEYYALAKREGVVKLPYEFTRPVNEIRTAKNPSNYSNPDLSVKPGSVVSGASDAAENYVRRLMGESLY